MIYDDIVRQAINNSSYDSEINQKVFAGLKKKIVEWVSPQSYVVSHNNDETTVVVITGESIDGVELYSAYRFFPINVLTEPKWQASVDHQDISGEEMMNELLCNIKI